MGIRPYDAFNKEKLMKKISTAVACAFAVILITMLIRSNTYSRTEYMLDTVITITADNRQAVDACFEEILRLEKLLSAYIPDSDIAKINASSVGEQVEVAPETVYLIQKANEYKTLTDGAFDISIKPVVDLWNIKNGGYVPDDSEIAEALSLTGDVNINEEKISLTKNGMQIDLGGIAKGYVGDRVREVLLSYGVGSAIADLGGNIVTIGKNGRNAWLVGLQKPDEQRGTTFAKIKAEDKVVVTSGGYERYFEKDGKKYHHIIDPATGENPDNNVLSVTIIAEDGTLADALSTACFIKGKDEGILLAEKSGVEAVIYTTDGIYYTDEVREKE